MDYYFTYNYKLTCLNITLENRYLINLYLLINFISCSIKVALQYLLNR